MNSIPFVSQATAAASVGSGTIADWLQTEKGWEKVRTRRQMHAISQWGAGGALAVLSLTADPSLPVAVACLTAALALQSCASAGFHPYIQVHPSPPETDSKFTRYMSASFQIALAFSSLGMIHTYILGRMFQWNCRPAGGGTCRCWEASGPHQLIRHCPGSARQSCNRCAE